MRAFLSKAQASSVMTTATPWAVVNTQPYCERIALDNLARQEFAAYCPMVRRRVKHARRTKEILRPLFPCYFFVRLDPQTQRWRPIMSTFGVRMLVRFGEQPALIADGFIQELKSHEIDGEIVYPARSYKVGQRVEVATGSFSGLVGTIIKLGDKDRMVVLINLLSRHVKVQVAAGMLSAG
jgi:transcriptional antiterminator RfaH